MEIFGVHLLGLTRDNLHRMLLTVGLILCLFGIWQFLQWVTRLLLPAKRWENALFWVRQTINLAGLVVFTLGMTSLWFSDPARLATAVGLVTAGLAFALQKVVTSFAGYFVLLRGKNFLVGDRILMGGVRGDVMGLDFLQTTIMEMGQPPNESTSNYPAWVKSRQFTGRIVTVANNKIFDEPVFNYTREFPLIWEEISLPVRYKDDRREAERILLEAANRHCGDLAGLGKTDLDRMKEKFYVRDVDMQPTVYYRLTDNWLELTVRFLVGDHGSRDIKNRISRDLLDGLEKAGIEVASSTYDIVGFPTLVTQR
jgi:small-conductance mechanosensitive channel